MEEKMLWEIPHVQVSHSSLEQLCSAAAQYPWQAACFPLDHSKYSPERRLNLPSQLQYSLSQSLAPTQYLLIFCVAVIQSILLSLC